LRHISLPGLTLAAAVAVAAVIAFVLMGTARGPGHGNMPLAYADEIRLIPGDDASRAQYGAAGSSVGEVLGETAGQTPQPAKPPAKAKPAGKARFRAVALKRRKAAVRYCKARPTPHRCFERWKRNHPRAAAASRPQRG
jgi:hypothetical protein